MYRKEKDFESVLIQKETLARKDEFLICSGTKGLIFITLKRG